MRSKPPDEKYMSFVPAPHKAVCLACGGTIEKGDKVLHLEGKSTRQCEPCATKHLLEAMKELEQRHIKNF